MTIDQAAGDSRQGTAPLWDADKFIDRISLYTWRSVSNDDNEYIAVGFAVFEAMRMAAEYEAKITELEAELADAQAWQPLPDGKHNLSGALSVHIKDGMAALYCHGWLMTLGFDDTIRLCCRTSSAGNAAESE